MSTLLDFLNTELKEFGLVAHRGDKYCGGVFVVCASSGQFAASIADNLKPQSHREGIDKATCVVSPDYTHIRSSLNKAVGEWIDCVSGDNRG